MNHKEMTAHIRNRLKAHKLNARVKMSEACGIKYITVVTKNYGSSWTEQESREIAICAQVNGLTMAQGSEIDIENFVQTSCFTGCQRNFEFHG